MKTTINIAHVADCHIGYGYMGPTDDARLKDIVNVMSNIADDINKSDADMVIFSGDAFKDSRVYVDRASKEIILFRNWLVSVSGDGKRPVVVISGTPSHDSVSAYSLLDNMELENVHIFTKPCNMSVSFDVGETKKQVELAMLPGMNRSNLVTKNEYRKMEPQEIHRLMSDKIKDICYGQVAYMTPDSFKILVSHLTYAEADTGFDHLKMNSEPVLMPEAVNLFNMTCLGHIHKPQAIENNNVFYCGSPERHSFSDEHTDPGYMWHTVDLLNNEIETTFIKTSARAFKTLSYEDNEATETLITTEHFTDVSGAIVRVLYGCDDDINARINKTAIEKNLYQSGAYFVSEIKGEISKTVRSRDEEVTEELGPVQAVEKWCVSKQIEPEKTEELKRLAAHIIG